MKINLRSLSRVISQKIKVSEEIVEMTLKSFIHEVLGHMKNGNIVGIKGFGTFFVSKRPGRVVRNPHTKEIMEYGDRTVPRMKFSTRVKRVLKIPVDNLEKKASDSIE